MKEPRRAATVAVTGANGFIGSRLSDYLEGQGFNVRRLVRVVSDPETEVPVGDIGPDTNWRSLLADVDCVVHLAARAHVFDERDRSDLTAFLRTNAQGTRRLVEHAIECGVRRMVFLSSAGVLGEITRAGERLSSESKPDPTDAYTESKLAAEESLREISKDSSLEVVIIRPPLVYGKNAPGNVARLAGLLRRGVPVPFGSIDNQRSFVSIENLIDFIKTCIEHPDAAGRTLLVSDGVDMSTPEMYRRIAEIHACRPRVFPFPVAVLRLAGRVLGKQREVSKVVDSLQLDISDTVEALDWSPSESDESPDKPDGLLA